jgi:transketolase
MNDMTMRDAFFDRLYQVAKEDRNVLVVSADIGAPALDKFRRDLRAQFINVGIAEQNMVTLSAGLSLSGKKVFMYAIMPFVTARCFEMIKVDLSLMNIPVTAVGVGAGFGYEDSGPTHHSTEDIAIMRSLPNMTILSPSDSVMAAEFAELACGLSGPSYIRLDRQILPVLYRNGHDFSQGFSVLKSGKDIWIVGTGFMVHRALEVAEDLSHYSVDAGVIDLYRLKPINVGALLDFIAEPKGLVTVEEHLLNGGLGSMMAEALADCGKRIPLKRIGIEDRYYYAYGRDHIQRLCKLDKDSILRATLGWIGKIAKHVH